MKRAGLIAATAIACLVWTGSASAASTVVTLDDFTPHYFIKAKRISNAFDVIGHLDSNKKKCVVGRKVTVFREGISSDEKVGGDTSDSNGGWSLMILSGDFLAGNYYAKAPKRVLHDGTTCGADRSETVANV
jgi:hypothetical protein